MNEAPESSQRVGRVRNRLQGYCLLWGVLLCLTGLPTALAQNGTGFDNGLPSGVLSAARPGLHLGRFDFHGGMQTTVSYDDLIQVTTNGAQSDVTWTISPFISAETAGPNDRTLRAFYRPGVLLFTDHSDLNTVNHAGNFELKFPFNRLTLGLAENVTVASMVVRDIGNRASQRSFSTVGTADYDFSDRTSFQGVLTYDRYDYEGEVKDGPPLRGSQQFGQQLWSDYHWSDRLSAGMGVSISELDVDGGSSQTSEGPEWRVNYTPTPQLSLRAAFGIQFRQFESGRSSTVEPVLRLNSTYQPRPGTSLTLEAHRAEMASGLNAGQNYVDTGFNFSINQVFLRRFAASLGGGYTMADYLTTETGGEIHRTDSYYSLRTSVNWNVADTVGLGLFYERTANDSNSGAFNFDHNIVGLQATWSF